MNLLAGSTAAVIRVIAVIATASTTAVESLMLSSVTGAYSWVFIVIESREVEVGLSVVEATVILIGTDWNWNCTIGVRSQSWPVFSNWAWSSRARSISRALERYNFFIAATVALGSWLFRAVASAVTKSLSESILILTVWIRIISIAIPLARSVCLSRNNSGPSHCSYGLATLSLDVSCIGHTCSDLLGQSLGSHLGCLGLTRHQDDGTKHNKGELNDLEASEHSSFIMTDIPFVLYSSVFL